MPFGLRRKVKPGKEEPVVDGKVPILTKRSKRERIKSFFTSKRGRQAEDKQQARRAEREQESRLDRQDAKPESAAPEYPALRKEPSPPPTQAPTTAPTARSPSKDTRSDSGAGVADASTTLPISPDTPVEEKIKPLSDDDIAQLFSGAPHFSVGLLKRTRRQQPQAAFPLDYSLVRDSSDSPPLSHPSFSAATLRKHLAQGGPDVKSGDVEYDIGEVEVPSMLSAQGLEPGTVGFDHFLQLAVSDNLYTGEQLDRADIEEARTNRYLWESRTEKLGIKPLDMRKISQRLVELGETWQVLQADKSKTTVLDIQGSGELYAHLYGGLLLPPRFDSSTEDPTGLKVQIEGLMSILNLKGIWVDYSLADQRIRLGQVLWANPDVEEVEPADIAEVKELIEQREKVLLQLVLACELLLRLDAVSKLSTEEVKAQLHLTDDEVKNFNSLRTKKVDWDLVFARRFLSNIHVIFKPNESEVPVQPTPQAPVMQRAMRSIFTSGAPPSLPKPKELEKDDVLLLPRNVALQLDGLLHFARQIKWPNLESLSAELSSKIQADKPIPLATPSIYSTPLATPRSTGTTRGSGYFDSRSRPGAKRMNSNMSNMLLSPSSTASGSRPASTALNLAALAESDDTEGKLDVGGWLSRSWLTGMVLPGEPIEHFLISTLLENDSQAIQALGDAANLYGGFVYAGRSWWSKTCIVGRVLAPRTGTGECMGWISLSDVPEGYGEGWHEVPSNTVPQLGKPRIAQAESIKQDSAIAPKEEGKDVLPSDFILPADSEHKPSAGIKFHSFTLERQSRDSETLEDDQSFDPDTGLPLAVPPTYTAALRFNTELGTLTIPLTHDVHFISSFPCYKPRRTSLFNQKSAHNNDESALPSLTQAPGHPLHISQRYTSLPVPSLLAAPPSTSTGPGLVSEPLDLGHSPIKDTFGDQAMEKGSEDQREILVLDAGGEDLEVLARAWCSMKGRHAIIGRQERSCLACCVREARALGVDVVIRV